MKPTPNKKAWELCHKALMRKVKKAHKDRMLITNRTEDQYFCLGMAAGSREAAELVAKFGKIKEMK